MVAKVVVWFLNTVILVSVYGKAPLSVHVYRILMPMFYIIRSSGSLMKVYLKQQCVNMFTNVRTLVALAILLSLKIQLTKLY